MKKIEAIIQPFKFEDVKEALLAIGVKGMTIIEAKGFGHEKGHTEIYRGSEFTVDVLPKTIIEIVAPCEGVALIVDTILKNAKTGRVGDGAIFVSTIDEALHISSEEAYLPVLESIRTRAYRIYEKNGRLENHQLEDWVTAEREVQASFWESNGAE